MFKFSNTKSLLFLILVNVLFLITSTVSSDDTQREFFKSGITFGFQWNGILFGDPVFIDPEYDPDKDEMLQEYLDDSFPGYAVIIENPLVDLPIDFMKTKMIDSPGDTLMIIHSKGKFYATVEKIQYLFGECYHGIVCILTPLDKEFNIEQISQDFMILRKNRYYSGHITSYKQYEITEPSYMAIVDSALKNMSERAMDYESGKLRRVYNNKSGDIYRFWLEDRQDAFYPFPFIIINSEVYGVVEKVMPDTLFVAITASVVANTSYGWTSLLEIYRDGDSWRSNEILEPHPGLKFKIICSVDLNNDNILEYFVFSWDGALYTYINGKLKLVVYAIYRGC